MFEKIYSRSARWAIPLDRNLLLLFVITFCFALSMNTLGPLFPLFIMSLGATVFQVGLVVSVSGVASTLLRFPSGFVADHVERRKLLFMGLVLVLIIPILYSFTTEWVLLIPLAMLFSTSFALFFPARMTLIADLTTSEKRASIYSFMNLAWPIGGILGPLIGGILADRYGWNCLFYFIALVGMAGLLPAICIYDPRSGRTENRVKEVEDGSNSLRTEVSGVMLPFFLLNLFIGLGFGTTSVLVPIYLTKNFSATRTMVGLFSTLGFGLTTLITQIPGGRLADSRDRGRLTFLALTGIPFAFVLWPQMTSLAFLITLSMLMNGLWSITWPATDSLLMEQISEKRRGTSVGITNAGLMAGFTMGPLIGGYLWVTLGQLVPFYVSAVFFIPCLLIASLKIKETID